MRNRTITSNLFNRLLISAEEAELQGRVKLAEHLTEEIESSQIREDEEFYLYPRMALEQDVESLMWKAGLRTADYFNVPFDPKEMEEIIEAQATDLIENLRLRIFGSVKLGAYEPVVPGEVPMQSVMEISENDLETNG